MLTINSLSSGIRISSLKPLDTSKLEIKKASPEMIAEMDEIWKNQFRIPVGKSDNQPDNIYATVKVNGKIVATLYNSGAALTSNTGYGSMKNLPSMGEKEKAIGPELAQKRAEEIAKSLGGKIEKASTAKTAAQWQPAKVEWTYDYKKMEEAEKERNASIEVAKNAREAFNASSQTKFDAQLIGQMQEFI